MKKSFPRDIPAAAAVAIVALVLLAGVVTGREPAALPEAAAPTEKRLPEPLNSIDEFDLKRLVRERRERNIEDLFADPAPPPAGKAAVIAAPAPEVKLAPEPPPAPEAPALPFTYLGQMKNGARVIVYLLKNQEMLLAETGQTLESQYQVADISDSAVQFVYLPLGTRQVLSIPPRQ
jgi:hypothetical protein